MMVVEHDMEFVAALSGDTGRVTVMARRQRARPTGRIDDVKRNDPKVIEVVSRPLIKDLTMLEVDSLNAVLRRQPHSSLT